MGSSPDVPRRLAGVFPSCYLPEHNAKTVQMAAISILQAGIVGDSVHQEHPSNTQALMQASLGYIQAHSLAAL